jgi:hypothetical protein
MVEFIYGAALNGTSINVSKYKVIKETPKTYVIDRPVGSVVRKATMSDRWENYYTDRAEAEKFLVNLFDYICKFNKQINVKYVHKELTELWTTDNISYRLKNLINYVE